MSTEEMQKMMMEALASGKVPVGTVVVGDQVEKKIIVEAGGIGEQTVNNYYGKDEPADSKGNSQKSTSSDKVEAAIKAVFESNLCQKADWAAVVGFLENENLLPVGQYSHDANIINRICKREVTSADSISRSIFFTKVSGKYPNLKIKEGEETRETPNKLSLYIEIGNIVYDAIKD